MIYLFLFFLIKKMNIKTLTIKEALIAAQQENEGKIVVYYAPTMPAVSFGINEFLTSNLHPWCKETGHIADDLFIFGGYMMTAETYHRYIADQ